MLMHSLNVFIEFLLLEGEGGAVGGTTSSLFSDEVLAVPVAPEVASGVAPASAAFPITPEVALGALS